MRNYQPVHFLEYRSVFQQFQFNCVGLSAVTQEVEVSNQQSQEVCWHLGTT